jgi:hypothetical protein
MYTLMLTKDERKAIDFVGNRYWNGYDLQDLLQDGEVVADGEWDSDGDVRYAIPENIAWDVVSAWELEEKQCPLFGPDLTVKIVTFLESIV